MRNLIIVGARGFGREVCSLAKSCIGYNSEFIIKGFLDDKDDALNGFETYPPILGSCEQYKIEDNDVFVCALGAVEWKTFYTQIILEKGGLFINLIHPLASIQEGARVGSGVIICQGAFISNDVTIGDFVTIMNNVVLGHDCSVGSYSHIGPFSFMGGFSSIDSEVTLNVRSTVLANIKISRKASVGASSLVIKNVKENTTVFGIPARVLKF